MQLCEESLIFAPFKLSVGAEMSPHKAAIFMPPYLGYIAIAAPREVVDNTLKAFPTEA